MNSCERVCQLISDPNIKLIDVLLNQEIRGALETDRSGRIVRYFFDHLSELIDYGFGLIEANQIAQTGAFIVLQILCRRNIEQHDEFHRKMLQFLHPDRVISQKSSTIFYKVVDQILRISRAKYFAKLPDPIKYFEYLLSHIDNIAISEHIYLLACAEDNNTFHFLEQVQASKLIMASLKDNDYANEKLLTYARLMLDSPKIRFDSNILGVFTNNEVIDKLFDLGYNHKNYRISAMAFRIIKEVIDFMDPDDHDDDLIFQTTFSKTSNQYQGLCKFVQTGDLFLENKYRAVEIILTVLSFHVTAEKFVLDLAGFLFDQTLKHRHHAFIHRSFYNLFLGISNDEKSFEQFLTKYNIKSKILDYFEDESFENTSFKGYLHEMVVTIQRTIGNKVKDEGDEWSRFVKEEHAEMVRKLKTSYGGRINREPFQDDNYIQPDSRELAIKLFGRSFFTTLADQDREYEEEYDIGYEEESL